MIKAVIFDMFETLITHYHRPQYFGTQMAEDAGIASELFLPMWRNTESERTLGKKRVDEVVEWILREHGCFAEEKLSVIMGKRHEIVRACLEYVPEEIVTMLSELKKYGIKIGLISNCFSEEAEEIRQSSLMTYFDAVCLSFEQGVKKPDPAIYERCMEKLSVQPEECIYVGDGGSSELEAAAAIGMKALQAAWFLKEGTRQPRGRMEDFNPLDRPEEIMIYIGEIHEENNKG